MTYRLGQVAAETVLVFSASGINTLSGTSAPASGATLSGTYRNSLIIESRQASVKLIAVQNAGAGSGRISIQVANNSGGLYVTLVSGQIVATSAANPYSGMYIATLTDPWPYLRLQHKDGDDGSGTNFNAFVTVA